MNWGGTILEAALAASAVVGLVVLAADRRRTANQAFVLLALTVAGWLGSVLEVFDSSSPGRAAAWIRSASMIGGFLPVAITMLRVSVVQPALSFLRVGRRILPWFAIYGLIVLYCATPLYLAGAEIPPQGVPNARYGTLSWVFPVYTIGGLVCALVSLLRDHRKAQGIMAVELEYVLAGLGCLFGAGIFAAVIPLIVRNSQIVPFAPLWFVAMNAMMAYGIATRRILSVGTLLRRAVSYLLLVVYLGAIYAAAWWGAASLLRLFSIDPNFAAPLFGTFCVAMSVARARSFLQVFVRKLFINLHQVDLRSTLRDADSLLTQVTTTEQLLESFLPLLGRAAGTDLVMVCLFDQNNSRRVWSTREPPPFEMEREAAARLPAMFGVLAVSIRNGNSVIGKVILGEKLSGKIYDREEQESIQLLANRLAVALVNAHHYTEQQRSKEYLGSLLGELPGGVLACDHRGIITVCNREAERLLRRPSAAVIGRPAGDLPHPFAAAFARVLAAGAGLRDQSDMLETGEKAVPVRYSTQVFTDSSRGAFLVFNDLTQIKQTREALHASEERFRNVFEYAGMGIAIADLTGRFVDCNQAYCAITGYSEKELLGGDFKDFVHEEDREENVRLSRQLEAGEIPSFLIENRYICKNGDAVWVRKFITVLRNDKGERTHRIALVTDISSRVKKDAELHRQAELLRLANDAQILRNAHDRAIAQLSQRALEGRSLNRLMEEAVSMVAQVLNVEFCQVLQLLPDHSAFLMHAGTGWKEGCVGHAKIATGKGSHAGFVLLSGAPVIVEDLNAETRFRGSQLLFEHGVTSGVSVIIHGRGKPYGVLGAHTGKRRHFTSDDVHFLQSIAGVLALTIVRTELENEMLDIISREQRSVGQDLHDSLCQELVGIQFKTGAFATKLTDDKQKAEARQICDYMRGAVNHARMLAKGLAPVHVETNGLMSALNELASNVSALFNVACRFECPREVMVADIAVSTHLYRIAQEAISNAIRHGGARNVIVSLDRADEEGILAIRDDGAGFSPDIAKKDGMGLHTMAYRAETIGAKLVIQGGPGEGSTVTCTFPAE